MRQTILGKSGLDVSRIAFGTWQLGGEWGPTDEPSATAAIRRAVDSGVNFFDTAQAYGFGTSERLLATALRGVNRADLVIATKGGLRPSGSGLVRDSSGLWLRQGVEASLRALQTSYIDLFQLHWPDPATPIEESAIALYELVSAGMVRHVGVSNFDVAQMKALDAIFPVETLQPPYHMFRREIEPAVLPYVAEHDIGVLAYGPLAHGLLGGNLGISTRFAAADWRATSAAFRGESFARNLAVVDTLRLFARRELGLTLGQLAIAWALTNRAVQVAIVGTRNPDHVDDAVVAADVDLSQDEIWAIEEILLDAVPIGGPSPETGGEER
jgi:aryl-alcohol dehydrogenase-like predicted oxidoreductase